MGPPDGDELPRRLTAEQRRQQLLQVALPLFAARGFSATTMDDIADAAGVTKPLLYQHFVSKRALYLELVDSVAQSLLNAIGKATAQAEGPRQQVEAGFSAYFELVVSQADAFHLLFNSEAARDPELARAVRHVEDVLAEAVDALIDADLDEDHRHLLAHAVVGMAEGASRLYLSGRLLLSSPAGSDPAPAGQTLSSPAGSDPAPAGHRADPQDPPGASGTAIGASTSSATATSTGAGTDGTGDGRVDQSAADRLARRLADLAWAGLRSVHRDS